MNSGEGFNRFISTDILPGKEYVIPYLGEYEETLMHYVDAYNNSTTVSKYRDQHDKYRDLRNHLRKVTGNKTLSIASAKLREILVRYNTNLFKMEADNTAFFNSESTGFWISEVLNFVANSGIILSNWYASMDPSLGISLNVSDLPEGNWISNLDEYKARGYDGDMTKIDNILLLKEFFSTRKVTLYTSDAGGDPKGHKSYELAYSKLQYGAALAGLVSLMEGGSMIVKQYTCYYPFTISVIAFYAELFDKVSIVKPMASRARSSEMYLVCIGYKGIDDETEAFLFDILREYDSIYADGMTPIDETSRMVNDICRSSQILTERQINELNDIIRLAEYSNQNYRYADLIDERRSRKYITAWMSINWQDGNKVSINTKQS